MTDLIFYLSLIALLIAVSIYGLSKLKIKSITACHIIGHKVEPLFRNSIAYHCPRCGAKWSGTEGYERSFNQKADGFAVLFIIAVALIVLTSTCQSAITPEFLSKVEAIESNGRANAIGDNGRSVGLFQFSRAAWTDCSKIRQKQGLSVYPYSNATNAYISRLYSGTWFRHLESRLVASRQKPTRELLLACHQCGINGVKRRNYDLQKVPKTTRNAIAQLNK